MTVSQSDVVEALERRLDMLGVFSGTDAGLGPVLEALSLVTMRWEVPLKIWTWVGGEQVAGEVTKVLGRGCPLMTPGCNGQTLTVQWPQQTTKLCTLEDLFWDPGDGCWRLMPAKELARYERILSPSAPAGLTDGV